GDRVKLIDQAQHRSLVRDRDAQTYEVQFDFPRSGSNHSRDKLANVSGVEGNVDQARFAKRKRGIVHLRRCRMTKRTAHDAGDFCLSRELMNPVEVSQLAAIELTGRALSSVAERSVCQKAASARTENPRGSASGSHRERDQRVAFNARSF